jgi:hypothetical protein
MTPSLLLVPILSFALAVPAERYAKVELQGVFVITKPESKTPQYFVLVGEVTYTLSFEERKDVPNKEELQKLNGAIVQVKGDLIFSSGDRGDPWVIVTTFMPVKK